MYNMHGKIVYTLAALPIDIHWCLMYNDNQKEGGNETGQGGR